MEATKLIEALGTLRAGFEKPPSDMEILRRAVLAQVARDGGLEMPPILSDDQRKVFVGKLDLVHGFLESEDGADAVQLVVDAFERFVLDREAPENSPGDGDHSGD